MTPSQILRRARELQRQNGCSDSDAVTLAFMEARRPMEVSLTKAGTIFDAANDLDRAIAAAEKAEREG